MKKASSKTYNMSNADLGALAVKRKQAGSWSSGNKTGTTAKKAAAKRAQAKKRGSEGPKRSMPRKKKK